MIHPPSGDPDLRGSQSPAPPPLQLEGVAHRFGRRWVLRGLDLRVEAGEVVTLAGPNGAGKTTLLRVAGTLLRPMRGTGWIRGVDLVARPEEARKSVGMIGHSAALYEDLTAAENLRFSLLMRELDAGRERILRILAEVGLSEHADTRVRRFSAGMRRRVAVGRILAAPPDLLLMDEPYASLDTEGVGVVNAMIGRVVASGGGVLLSTHDLHSGAQLTDRVLTLDIGLLHEGSPSVPPHSRPVAPATLASPGPQESEA
jgi:ABC-2 type transport system ATP-binding protein